MKHLYKFWKKCNIPHIIPIQETNPFAFSIIKGEVTGGGDTGIWFVENAEAMVFLGVFIEDGTGVIRRAIVHAQTFPIGKGLRKHGVQALTQVWRDIVNGNDDGKEGLHNLNHRIHRNHIAIRLISTLG